MQIPIGARIDRKTWEITPLYREGSVEEFIEAMRPFAEVARMAKESEKRKGEVPMTGATR